MKVRTMFEFVREYVRPSRVEEMSVEQVRARLGTPGFHLFDANTRAHWEEGHLPGAVHVGMEGVSAAVLPVDRDATLVFYCAGAL